MIKPRVLAVLPGFVPSTLMDVVKPLLALDQQGRIRFRVTVEALASSADLRWADLLIFSRNVEQAFSRHLAGAISQNTPLIYDIDDNFFEIDPRTPLGQYHRHPSRLAMLEAYLRSASLVRVYSSPMLERIEKINSRVDLVKPPLDWDLITVREKPYGSQPVKIVYPTSRVEDAASKLFLPALRRVLHDCPGRVEMYFWGWKPEEFEGKKSVFYLPPVFDYASYLQQFSAAGFDIGLAPLLDDLFHRSKTNNKFREYSACRIAGIYSNSPVYAEAVVHEETGLLVANEEDDWYSALRRLIDDAALREKIQRQAEDYSRKMYAKESFEETWLSQIQAVLSNSKELKPSSMAEFAQVGTPLSADKPERNDKGRGITGPKRLLMKLSSLVRQGEYRKIFAEIRRYAYTFRLILWVNVFKKL